MLKYLTNFGSMLWIAAGGGYDNNNYNDFI